MNKIIPDKFIRKAVFDAFNGTVVDGVTVNVYDSFVTSFPDSDKAYIVISSQGNEVDANKCAGLWEHDVLLEVCTWYKGTGNTGSRLLADNILDELRDALKGGLDLSAGGLEVVGQVMSFPNDRASTFPNGTLIRKFLRLELRIN